MITLAGIIGSGKSSLTDILSKELGSKPFFEPVDDNPVLPLFYKGNEAAVKQRQNGNKKATNPYTYLLQTFFINRRFKMIKRAKKQKNNILDRSIYEDALFMKMNTDIGNATTIEYNIYNELLDNMLNELKYVNNNETEDLMIFIKVSYNTMIKHIKKRGRSFEQIEYNPSLVNYYKKLLTYYNNWIKNYDKSPLIVINGDKYNFVDNEKDKNIVLDQIEQKLLEINYISYNQVKILKNKRYK